MLKLSAAGWLQMYTSSASSIEHFDNKTKTKSSIGSKQLNPSPAPPPLAAGGLFFLFADGRTPRAPGVTQRTAKTLTRLTLCRAFASWLSWRIEPELLFPQSLMEALQPRGRPHQNNLG